MHPLVWPIATLGYERKSTPLYRNRGDGTFADVARSAGLGVERYGIGVAGGDYDNDGRQDLFLTGLGANALYHNNGAEAEQTRAAWLRAQSDAVRPHWMLGRVLLGNNRVEDAVREFDAARAREPGQAEYCLALGGA